MPRENKTWRPGIYAIENQNTGKVYVGSSALIAKRWSEHRLALRRGTHISPHLRRAWAIDGEAAFAWRVLEYCPVEQLLEREQYWADFYQSYNPASGYNIRHTVGSSLGVKLSEDTRQRMRLAHLGKKQTPEHIRRSSEARRGRVVAPELRVLMGAANRRIPEETVLRVVALVKEGTLPQVKIAERCGVSQRYVSKVKHGQVAWLRQVSADD